MTPHNAIQRIVELFLRGKLSGLLIILSLAAGAIALLATPREEEPQIVVPLADVFVSVPGATAAEVERQVTTPLEKFVSQIDGVEYVYSMSRPGSSIVTVRFFVGENREDSLVKLQTNLAMHVDAVPAMVQGWVVKPVEIDDVPIFTATLYSDAVSPTELRRIAQEIQLRLQSVPDTGPTAVLGGQPLVASVHPDPEQLASRGLSIADVQRALAAANINLPAGQFSRDNQRFIVEAGSTLADVRDLESLVIAVADNRPVYLRDVASINLAPDEVTTYTNFYQHGSSAEGSLPG
ncbi:MAG: efflux RND transporter permease subunit, partial [Phycisphaeraceae bacterium]|nr:efflux RND transporter permease subunit [Phycisphaeraceae bacterium]